MIQREVTYKAGPVHQMVVGRWTSYRTAQLRSFSVAGAPYASMFRLLIGVDGGLSARKHCRGAKEGHPSHASDTSKRTEMLLETTFIWIFL